MVSQSQRNRERSSNRRGYLFDVDVMVDMYALGKAGEVLPADEVSADRLDLLTAQVLEGLTRLKEIDFGFPKDPIYGFAIDLTETNFTLNYYDHESEQSSGQYAPARWAFTVQLVYVPTDNNDYNALEELNIVVKKDELDNYAALFQYEVTP
jgi:hypothetical protein